MAEIAEQGIREPLKVQKKSPLHDSLVPWNS